MKFLYAFFGPAKPRAIAEANISSVAQFDIIGKLAPPNDRKAARQ
jgi:hypothetical protein